MTNILSANWIQKMTFSPFSLFYCYFVAPSANSVRREKSEAVIFTSPNHEGFTLYLQATLPDNPLSTSHNKRASKFPKERVAGLGL
jgi:hypothetical protein